MVGRPIRKETDEPESSHMQPPGESYGHKKSAVRNRGACAPYEDIPATKPGHGFCHDVKHNISIQGGPSRVF